MKSNSDETCEGANPSSSIIKMITPHQVAYYVLLLL